MAVQIRSEQMKFNSKVAYDSHPSFSADTDIVDKKYVDDLVVSGITWKDPVLTSMMMSNADGSGSLPGVIVDHGAYVVNNWGTDPKSDFDLTLEFGTWKMTSGGYNFGSGDVGKWVTITAADDPKNIGSWKIGLVQGGAAYLIAGQAEMAAEEELDILLNTYPGVDGDIVEASVTMGVTDFVILLENSAGDPPAGTRVLVADDINIGGDFVGHENDYAVFGSGGAVTFAVPDDGDALLVNGNGSFWANKQFVFEEDSGWIQIAGPAAPYTAGNGIQIVGLEISVKAADGGAVVVDEDGVDITGWDTIVSQNGVLMDLGNLVSVSAHPTRGLVGIANAPEANPVIGDVYIVSSSPSGAFSGFAENDVVELNGSSVWTKIGVYSNAVDSIWKLSSTVVSPFTPAADENKLAFWDSSSPSWKLITPQKGYSVVGLGYFGTDRTITYGTKLVYSVLDAAWVAMVTKADGTTIQNSTLGQISAIIDTTTGLHTSAGGIALNAATATKSDWNGSATEWTLSDDVNDGFLIVTLNGSVCQKDGSGVGSYTWTSGTKKITFGSAPTANSITQAYYFKKT